MKERHVTLQDALSHLPQWARESALTDQAVIIHGGQEPLVLLSQAQYQALLETLDVQGDPDFLADLHESLHEAQGQERLPLREVRRKLGVF